MQAAFDAGVTQLMRWVTADLRHWMPCVSATAMWKQQWNTSLPPAADRSAVVAVQQGFLLGALA